MHRTTTLLLVAFLVVSVSAVPAGAQSSGAAATIENVNYTGTESVALDGSDLAIWHSGTHQFTVNLSSSTGAQGQVCLVTSPVGSDAQTEVTCQDTSVEAGSTTTQELPVLEWPKGTQGDQEVTVIFRSASEGELDRTTFPLTIITRSGDMDDDSLTNEREVALGTGIENPDTDGDGLLDGMEAGTYGTDPTAVDTDGDGLDDPTEVNEYGSDPTEKDTDGDGLPDPRERVLGTNPTKVDSDDDGLEDGPEVSVHETDPLNADTDGDGLGDGVEVNKYETNPRKADTDGDGLSDNMEVNTYGTDPTKVDTDGDGVDDGTEVHSAKTDPTAADSDGDGLSDGQEIHTYETEPTNPDTDGDGLEDGPEVNEYGTNPKKVDTDDDGQGDYAAVKGDRMGPLQYGALGAITLVVIGAFLHRSGRVPKHPGRHVRDGWGALRARLPASMPAPTDGGDTESGSDTTTSGPAMETLSKEEQILALLDENDGRMRQAEIVAETDWSKSTVSRVLADMEAAEQVVKIDVGRENVVTRPEDSPEGAASPFES